MDWVFSSWTEVWHVAAKMIVLFLLAVLMLRLTERRTVARFSVFDFVASVAVGTIIARTATSATTPLVHGAVALVVLMLGHTLLSRTRYSTVGRRLVDHRPRILVVDGQVQRRELTRVGLTEADLHSAMREKGLTSAAQAQLVVYESKGTMSIFRREAPGHDLLVAAAHSAGQPTLVPE